MARPLTGILEYGVAATVVFKSVTEALQAGFHIYDRTPEGYLARTQTANGWAVALIIR